uniref:ABM domain-containing protein n=1 Tax=Pycnococcus provasolii TaxID=41880 RepID=A0A7S2FB25_9CHLO|mmetsp:Transcript_5430/g.12479  ORF Transcript_5430/g.12479 Transcript_5430/m.12479 type:complete len:212 (+) Transcript_5430:39-674(+)
MSAASMSAATGVRVGTGEVSSSVRHRGVASLCRPLRRVSRVHSRSSSSCVCMAIKVSNQSSVAFTAMLKASSGSRLSVMEKLQKYVDDMQDVALESSSASNNSLALIFAAQEDSHEEGTFHLWQRYRNAQDMLKAQEHVTSKIFYEEIRPSLSQPVALATYDCRADGSISPCCVPFGPKGEGGMDDATGAAKMAAGAAAKQTMKVDDGLLR